MALFDKEDKITELKTFDKILADANSEHFKTYVPITTLKEICMDCKINYLNL